MRSDALNNLNANHRTRPLFGLFSAERGVPGQARARPGDEVRGMANLSAASDKSWEWQQILQPLLRASDPVHGFGSDHNLTESERQQCVPQRVTGKAPPIGHLRAPGPQSRGLRQRGRQVVQPCQIRPSHDPHRPEKAFGRAARRHVGLRAPSVEHYDHRPLLLQRGICHSPTDAHMPEPMLNESIQTLGEPLSR